MEWLDKCLSSLRNSQLTTDVFIVDNGSIDQTIPYTKEHFPEVVVLEQNENLGFGKANNVGLLEAYKKNYEFFFLLNQDAWVEENVIGNLTESLIEKPEFGLLSPVHLNGNGTNYDRLFKKAVNKYIRGDQFLERGQEPPMVREIRFVNAAAWMISRECIEKVGLFHPLFFHYGEDDNYVDRVCAAKLKVGLLPKTYIYHDRETRKSNPLKDDLKRKFDKESLTMLLKPQAISRDSSQWTWAFFRILLIEKSGFSLKDIIRFYQWAIKQHIVNIQKRKDFILHRSNELYPNPRLIKSD